MADLKIVIFIAPPDVAKVTGRYICILRSGADEPGVSYSDNSLVDLAATLGDKVTEWYMIEDALNKTGVFSN
jgi:hypothetical protein